MKYLKDATKVDLQTKLEEINSFVEEFVRIWDQTNFDDLSDSETTGYESAMGELFEIRDPIKQLIQDRIDEMQTTSFDATIREVEETAQLINQELKTIDSKYLHEATKNALEETNK